jgi:hypothetical protein
MSGIFPHDAVVERYLHTGPRRSSRKLVIGAFLAGVACAAVAANLPAGWLASESSGSPSAPKVAKRSDDACKERTWPYNRCADAPATTAAAPREPDKAVRVVEAPPKNPPAQTANPPPQTAAQQTIPAPATDPARQTTGTASAQPNSMPSATSPNPAPTSQASLPPANVPPASTTTASRELPPSGGLLAPSPSGTAALTPAPAAPPSPAPGAGATAIALPPAQVKETPPVASPAPHMEASARRAEPTKPQPAEALADEPAAKPKKVVQKAAVKRARTEARARTAARARAARPSEPRIRAARQTAPDEEALPTMVRIYDLPDGRRIYQRVRGGEPGYGEARRVYLAPMGEID